jgi:hypothetical protein
MTTVHRPLGDAMRRFPAAVHAATCTFGDVMNT